MMGIRRKVKLSLYCAIAFVITIFSGVLADDLGLGTAGVTALTVEKERDLGKYFMIYARSNTPMINDPVLSQYLQALGARLLMKADDVKFPYELFWIEEKSINAAAFLGGKIMVHSGLIEVTDTESELASVLAHEITHVTQRHLARQIEEQENATIRGMASIIGSIILGIINPAVGMAGVSASIAGMQQNSIDYTRSFEYEADRIGIDLLHKAKFNPLGMANMMRKLQTRGEQINPAFEMLLTHPLSNKRVAEAENRAISWKREPYYESPDFGFAKSRIEVRYSVKNLAYNIDDAKHRLARNSDDYAARYKLALSSLANGDLQTAASSLQILKAKFPKNLFIIDSLTDLYVAQKDYKSAIDLLTSSRNSIGDNEVLVVNLAAVYLEQKSYDKAINLLKQYKRIGVSAIGDDMLLSAYKGKKDYCNMYMLSSEINESKGNWVQARQNAKEATQICAEKNTILKLQALMGRITKEQDFYENLVKN